MSILGDRVRERRKQLGMSQTDLAEAIKSSQQSIGHIERGSRLRPRKLKEIAETLNVSEDWLLGVTDNPSVKTSPNFLQVLGEVQAGAFIEAIPYHDDIILPVVPNPKFKGYNQYMLKVVGNSMDQHYPNGSYVHCVHIEYDPNELAPEHGDHVIVERRLGAFREVTVKEYVLTSNGAELWPRSNDARWKEPITLHNGEPDIEIQITALVVGFYFSR